MLSEVIRIILELWAFAGIRNVVLVGLIITASFLEGMGLSLLLPLLSSLGVGEHEVNSFVVETVFRIYSFLNVDMTVKSLLLGMATIFAVQYLLFIAHSWSAARLQWDFVSHLRKRVFSKVINAEWLFFVRLRLGVIVNAILGETTRLGSCVYLIVSFANLVVLAIIYTGLAFLISYKLTIGILAVGFFVAIFCYPIIRHGHKIGSSISENMGELQGWSNEVLGGAKIVKATNAERYVCYRFEEIVEKLRINYVWAAFNPNLIRAIFEGTGLLALMGGLYVSYYSLGVKMPELITVVAIFIRLTPRISTMQQMFQQIIVQIPAYSNIKRIEMEARLVQEYENESEKKVTVNQGAVDIVVKDLTVFYEQCKVLDKVSLEVPKGAIVGIAGPSGAGKTTLLDCLLKMVEPRKGHIMVNKVDLKAIHLAEWRRRVGYVTQETILFNDTIRENIRWADENASDEDIVNAARLANMHDFIMGLSQGYDTIVGERGVRLSGGQRQRIGLARALMGDISLLVLDEATSSLDSEAERSVMNTIGSLRENLTILIVAHRLSTLRDADLIYYMQNGRVVESGTWEELLSHNCYFCAMWRMQRG